MKTEELRSIIERRQMVEFWLRKYFITPRLVEEIFGDGKQLVYIQPIMQRPNYYVVRGDSNWSLSNWSSDDTQIKPREWVDRVQESIELEFGSVDDETVQRRRRFPLSTLDEGCSWGPYHPPAKAAKKAQRAARRRNRK